jgi:hypothetical protein
VATASSSIGSSSGGSRLRKQAATCDVDGWGQAGSSSSSWGYDESIVDLPWVSSIRSNSSSRSRAGAAAAVAAAAEQRSCGCGGLGEGSGAAGSRGLSGGKAETLNGEEEQLQSVAGAAAGVCGTAGPPVGMKGRITATRNPQESAIAEFQSCKPAVGLGLGAMCKAAPTDSAQAMCIGNADVQSCFAQEGPAAAAGPDFVEWDVWYAGLASLVE